MPPAPGPTPSPRLVSLLAFPDVQVLDVTGPLEVFAQADRFAAEADRPFPGYRVEVLAPEPGPFTSSGGVVLQAQARFVDRREGIDTLLVAGGNPGIHAVAADPAVQAWLRDQAGRVRRLAGICTGALALAAAGLLDGRRATTHWASCALLAERHPAVTVEPDAIFVRDGRFATSAGVTAGMDLALALVEEDAGPAVALAIARNLVMFARRPGGQTQFSAHLAAQQARTPPMQRVRRHVLERPGEPLPVERLAEIAGMSPRSFARRFRAEFGTTPARFVERARLDAVRGLLGTAGCSLQEAAARCGFGSEETLRRAFHRHLGVSPSDYRARFPVGVTIPASASGAGRSPESPA